MIGKKLPLIQPCDIPEKQPYKCPICHNVDNFCESYACEECDMYICAECSTSKFIMCDTRQCHYCRKASRAFVLDVSGGRPNIYNCLFIHSKLSKFLSI